MKTEIKAAIITGLLGIIGTISAAFIGINVGEKNAVQQLYSQMTAIYGDNNTVTINSVDDFIAQYNKVLNENEILKAQNSQYFADYTEQKNISDSLESQLGERPVVSYNNLGLCIDGEDIPINKQKSIVTIDGREYYSKELAECFLNDDQSVTVKDDTLFVGKVIAEKANLLDQNILNKSMYLALKDTVKDSYGNTRRNAIMNGYYSSDIIFSLNEKYTYLKFTVSMSEYYDINYTTALTIISDDEITYVADVGKETEPYTIEIPINNCKKLKIQFDSACGSNGCIISDAIVYN